MFQVSNAVNAVNAVNASQCGFNAEHSLRTFLWIDCIDCRQGGFRHTRLDMLRCVEMTSRTCMRSHVHAIARAQAHANTHPHAHSTRCVYVRICVCVWKHLHAHISYARGLQSRRALYAPTFYYYVLDVACSLRPAEWDLHTHAPARWRFCCRLVPLRRRPP